MPKKKTALVAWPPGHQLNALVNASGLTRYQVAERAGVSRTTLAGACMGLSRPHRPKLSAILRAIGKTEEDMESAEPDRGPSPHARRANPFGGNSGRVFAYLVEFWSGGIGDDAEPPTPRQIGDALGLHPSYVSEILRRLVKARSVDALSRRPRPTSLERWEEARKKEVASA